MARHGGPPKTLWCVVLAAGGSRRLGAPKQLLRRRARPLLLRVIDIATGVAPGRVVVVLGAHRLRLRTLLARNAGHTLAVGNPRWRDGMASSLQAGLKALPARTRAALVLLTDQPHVTTGSVERLLRAWRTRPGLPAAAYYRNGAGAPAVLPRRCWATARALQGDVGARALLREGPVTLVRMPEAAFDVDKPEDLIVLQGNAAQARRL